MDDNTTPGFFAPLPNMAGPGGAPLAYSPQAIQQAYLKLLQERSKQKPLSAYYSPLAAVSDVANAAADQVQLGKMMQMGIGQQQANASLALPTGGATGGGGGSSPPAAPASPAPDLSGGGAPGATGGDQAAPGGNAGEPASIRNNNPGAQWPGESATRFGSTGAQTLASGNKIATFADPVNGAAAQFDLMDRRYTGMTLRQAITKWSGNTDADAYTRHVASMTGLSPDTVITKEALRDPKVAVPLGQAMAYHEAGRPFPLSPEQWTQAHRMAFAGEPAPGTGNPLANGPPGASQVSPGATGGGAQAPAQVAKTRSQSGQPDAFAPRRGTFVAPDQLPGRPQRNWQDIQRRWFTLSPQEQENYRKEFTDTNGGKNPMVRELPGVGNIEYHPENPGQQTFYPTVHVEKSKDASGNDREFEYVLDPQTNARTYRNGVAPPTAEESMAGAAKAAGMKTESEQMGKAANSIYQGSQGLGTTGRKVANIADGLLPIIQDENWRSGGMPETRLAIERLKNSLGMDNNASNMEVVRRGLGTMKSLWQDGMKSNTDILGDQARLFQSEINAINPIIGGLDETKGGLTSGLQTIKRLGNHWGDLADDVDAYVGKLPGQLPDRTLNKFIRDREANFHLLVPEVLPDKTGKTETPVGVEPPAAPPATAAPPAGTPPAAAPPAAPGGAPGATPFSPQLNYLFGAPKPPPAAKPLPRPGAPGQAATANPIAQALMVGDAGLNALDQKDFPPIGPATGKTLGAAAGAAGLGMALPFAPELLASPASRAVLKYLLEGLGVGAGIGGAEHLMGK